MMLDGKRKAVLSIIIERLEMTISNFVDQRERNGPLFLFICTNNCAKEIANRK